MAKVKYRSAWFCNECGGETPKWAGRCPACGAWNTLTEQRVATGGTVRSPGPLSGGAAPVAVNDIVASAENRIAMPSGELNRVLGGGLVAGSMVLIGGEPGIGKSTLVLQTLLAIKSKTVLYVSGEESASQLKLRADRIGRGRENVLIVCETRLERIMDHVEAVNPGILVVDSIQTIASDALESAAGSVSQVRECAARLLQWAKSSNVPVRLIGHITKDGTLAGPKVLEHIVDAVLQFEGDSKYMYRILRPIKNRFGSTGELGIYEMHRRGLREVTDPGSLFVGRGDERLSGVAIGVTVEGARPRLVECQALVSTAAYGTPQRTVTGFDAKRMNMLLAVLEKRVGFRLGQKDVVLNMAGGLRVGDPGAELAAISAVLSSNVDMAVAEGWCMAGEVGLTGETRPVARMEQRITEAAKLGMTDMLVPRGALKGLETSALNIRLHEVGKVDEAFRTLFA